MKLQKLFFAAVIVLSANAAFAQQITPASFSHNVTINIPNIALLDLESSDGALDFSLIGTAPNDAGLPMTFETGTATNSTIWMNYTSIVGTSVPLRNVQVELTTGTVPDGLKLTVTASGASDNGAGAKGAGSAIILLPLNPLNIVTGIGSAWTGTGTQGHNLTYELDYDGDYSLLDFDNTPLTITYTLSEI